MAKSIMIQGTASGVGKSVITTALCRIFKQDGHRVAPFKSQNMTSNTASAGNGDEIAVSQLLQAHAAGVEPDTRMNPVILKPSPERKGTQVLLRGRVYGTIDAGNSKEIREALLPEIIKAYDSLAWQFDIIVIEGAGSPVELNINECDIVNMGVAKCTGAPVLIVSDIDRGGIFASLYGTVSLLSETERAYVKGMIVNRFRGDISLFADGKSILERITGLPVAGIVPYFSVRIPEEDELFGKDSLTYTPGSDYDRQFDIIAGNVRRALDMELIYGLLGQRAPRSASGCLPVGGSR